MLIRLLTLIESHFAHFKHSCKNNIFLSYKERGGGGQKVIRHFLQRKFSMFGRQIIFSYLNLGIICHIKHSCKNNIFLSYKERG